MNIEKEIITIKLKLAYEGGRSSMARRSLLDKMDEILEDQKKTRERLDKLPCDVHSERHKWITRGLAGCWAVILFLFGWILTKR